MDLFSRSHKKFLNKVTSFLLILSLLFTIAATKFSYSSIYKSYQISLFESMENATSFDEFCRSLFCYELSFDSVTTAYSLENPQAYHIPKQIPTLTSFSCQSYEKDNSITSSTNQFLIHCLNQFHMDELTKQEQLTYTLLKNTLLLNSQLSQYPYYTELLGSTTGVQASLPITLGEYPLRDKASVETYLQLLKQVPDYFNNVISYEKIRIEKKLLPEECIYYNSCQTTKTILEGLQGEENSFIQTFNERLASLQTLSKKEKSDFMAKNEDYVKKYILPAYETLYEYLSSVSSSTPKLDEHIPYGLSTLPNGKDYYRLLVKQATGSSKTLDSLTGDIEASLENSIQTVRDTAITNPKLYTYYCNNEATSYCKSPQSILETLFYVTRNDYPALSKTPDYEIKMVSNSLATSSNPAFYMIPPVDNTGKHTIYINPLFTNNESGNLFTTLAHEGFPGHLYQTVYFQNTNPNEVRQILNYPGYVEGWATYVEINSYQYLDYPKDMEALTKLYQSDTIISLAISSRIDIGVNYENWTLSDVEAFFENYGFHSFYAKDIYNYVVESPANYLSYFIGYLELTQLKTDYKNLNPDMTSDEEFHKKILEAGPCDFDSLRNFILSNE